MVVDLYPRHRMEGAYGCSKESEIQSTTEEGAGKKVSSPEKVRSGKEKGYGEEKAGGPARRTQEEAGSPAGRSEKGAVGATGASPQGATGKPPFAAPRTGRARGATGCPGR